MQLKRLSLLLLPLLPWAAIACQSQDAPTPTEPATGMANPASVHCQENDGILEIRTDARGGQYVVCLFPDGSECEEWAFFRGECQPGDSMTAPSPQPLPGYINDQYGFSFNPPSEWAIESYDDHVIFRRKVPQGGEYTLFVGFRRIEEEGPPFRPGMPQGDFVDGSSVDFLGQMIPQKLLVFEGKTKVVEYGANLPAGELRLFIWLDIGINAGEDYMYAEIPPEIIAEADQIVASFALLR